MSLSDPDHPIYFLATGLLVFAAVSLSLVFGYSQWEATKDLRTIATVGGTYFAAAGARLTWRYVRNKQADGD